jgi:hypothetical protein
MNERSRQRPASDSGESAGALFLMAGGGTHGLALKPRCRVSAEIRGVMAQNATGVRK